MDNHLIYFTIIMTVFFILYVYYENGYSKKCNNPNCNCSNCLYKKPCLNKRCRCIDCPRFKMPDCGNPNCTCLNCMYNLKNSCLDRNCNCLNCNDKENRKHHDYSECHKFM